MALAIGLFSYNFYQNKNITQLQDDLTASNTKLDETIESNSLSNKEYENSLKQYVARESFLTDPEPGLFALG